MHKKYWNFVYSREQDRLKKEMMVKVETVAGEFRKVAHNQMAATTQRTIRENVNISSQLAQLTEKASSLTTENDKIALKVNLEAQS